MTAAEAERLVLPQVKPIFGFCLKRCATVQDAEDLAQEIILRYCQRIQQSEPLLDPQRYLWTIAHHCLANHYRDRARLSVGIPDDSPSPEDVFSGVAHRQELDRLFRELARLSRQQRQILIAHYFEGMRQSDIASRFQLPPGTVKWHLHEARKELKYHMNRPVEHLQFHPVRFTGFATDGSIGSMGSCEGFFASLLRQNIAYAVRSEPRTALEIASILGMPAPFVEDEADFLARHGFLLETGGRYLLNMLMDDAAGPLADARSELLRRAARLLAPAMLQALKESDLWSGASLYIPQGNRTLALWALLPYLIAQGETEDAIPFDQVAVIRPDGGRNLCRATVDGGTGMPAHSADERLRTYSGPCWCAIPALTLWSFESFWSRPQSGQFPDRALQEHDMLLLLRFLQGDALPPEELAMLARQGYIRIELLPDGTSRSTLLILWIRDADCKARLQTLAADVRHHLRDELTALLTPFHTAMLEATPPHLRTSRRYDLQQLLCSGEFIVHCLLTLVDDGLLTPPENPSLALSHIVITP